MDTSKKVVPVGWFRVAVATQLMLEGMVASVLVSILRAVAVSLTEDPDSVAMPLEVLNFAMYAYFGMGAMVLLYALLFAKPPSEAEFTKTKWWMAWALMHRPGSVARCAGRGRPEDVFGDGARAHSSESSPELNPSTGSLMVPGTMHDIGGHNLGD